MKRRTGDSIAIPGDYQARAMASGNAVQRFWHETKKLTIEELLPPASTDMVLDVGCGSGIIASFLGGSGARVLGIDGNNSAVAFATENFSTDRVSFRKGLVDETFSLDEAADKIYCLEVIEHIYRDQAAAMLAMFHRLLKPGGKVFLTTPNYRSAWPAIEWGLDRFTSAAHLDGDQHVLRLTPKTLAELCEETGFHVNETRTTSLLAPWVAPLSWSLARCLHNREIRSPFLIGSILVCVLEK